MNRLAAFLLVLGVMIGLSGQSALATMPAMAGMTMAKMSQTDMSAMPDCMASMSKDATHKPCKCGMAGCIAMMTGAPLILAEGSDAFAAVAAGDRQNQAAKVVALHGCFMAPDLEPPSILI